MRISVCMATYNGEKYIKEQLDSILCQLSAEDEIIISDDESTDRTLEIVASYRDERIKVFSHQKNEKYQNEVCGSFFLSAENFENAIKMSRGEYIYFSDQDDLWMPARIQSTLPFLRNHDLVMCNYTVVNSSKTVLIEQFFSRNPLRSSVYKNLFNTPFLGCCMAIRREALFRCLPFPKPCIGHDLWVGCITCSSGRFMFIEQTLHLYRKHNCNVSPATGESQNTLLFKILYRITFLRQYYLQLFKIKYRKQ